MADGDEYKRCGVCGRNILRGERVIEYATPDGERIEVCSLCRPAAESAGWIPSDRAGTVDETPSTGRRGRLRERLSRASGAARELASRPSRRTEPQADEPPLAPEPTRRPPQRPQPPQQLSPERRMRAALGRFNASDQARVVAGLIRSLGEPRVAVRAGSAGKTVVTVAWELSWYQWEVGADGDDFVVRERKKGKEVSELATRDRHWNAIATEDGTVRVETAGAARAGSTPS